MIIVRKRERERENRGSPISFETSLTPRPTVCSPEHTEHYGWKRTLTKFIKYKFQKKGRKGANTFLSFSYFIHPCASPYVRFDLKELLRSQDWIHKHTTKGRRTCAWVGCVREKDLKPNSSSSKAVNVVCVPYSEIHTLKSHRITQPSDVSNILNKSKEPSSLSLSIAVGCCCWCCCCCILLSLCMCIPFHLYIPFHPPKNKYHLSIFHSSAAA